MDPTEGITSGTDSKSDSPSVAAANELFTAIQKWAASDPDGARRAAEFIKAFAEGAPKPAGSPRPKLEDAKKAKRRAICLAGGGPAAGLHIGVLNGLKNSGVTFDKKQDVWALSCIGAWVGVIYNQAEKGKEIEETTKFFRDVFRNDASFKSFPANTVFTPDWAGNAEAMLDFLVDPSSYRNAFVPREIIKSFMYTVAAIRRGASRTVREKTVGGEKFEEFELAEFSEGDFNRWTLNHVLAVNPAVRFLTGLLYKSKVSGLSRLYYPDSRFLNNIKFEKLNGNEKPFIFHNAWNLTDQKLVLFANRDKPAEFIASTRHEVEGYISPINSASLCACSALPFIEQTVEIDGKVYCEGALIDTVNFTNLLRDNELDEVWISRIVDANQVLPPRNLHDSLANLCELFCATVGEDDVDLFKCCGPADAVARERWKKITIVEIPVDPTINFDWSHCNLDHGIRCGERAAYQAVERYIAEADKPRPADGPLIIPAPNEARDRIEREQRRRERLRIVRERLIEAGRADC
jgi:predicted acylesterase/phospholipase RssA